MEVSAEHNKVLEIASEVRSLFMEVLKTSLQKDDSDGSCAYACILAKQLFDQFSDFKSVFRGGNGKDDGGYIDSQGVKHGHYWLEVDTGTGQFIVDITADQFGAKPIVVLPLILNNQYLDGDQQTVESHMAEILKEIYGTI